MRAGAVALQLWRPTAPAHRFKRSASPKLWIEASHGSLLVLTNLRLFVEFEVLGEGLLG
jgi:hypothetical protein